MTALLLTTALVATAIAAIALRERGAARVALLVFAGAVLAFGVWGWA